MARKRSHPIYPASRSSLRAKENASSDEQTPHLIAKMEHAKRQRTHGGTPSTDTANQPCLRDSYHRPASELDSYFSRCPDSAPYHSAFEDSSHVFSLPQETSADIPRVASSAHINELVARYSTPYSVYQEQDTWFQQTGCLPGLSNPGALYSSSPPPELLEARVSDVTSQELQAVFGVPATYVSGVPGDVQSLDVGKVCSPEAKDSFFEDLTLVAVNVNISQMEVEDVVVGGLSLGEDTRHIVEQWLRDSPVHVRGFGLTSAPTEGEAAEEGERSLPQWVLEELGEGARDAEVQTEVKPRSLDRADSNGSSTNVPSFSLKGDVWDDQEGVCSKKAGGKEETLQVKDVVTKTQKLEKDDLSVHSCAGGEDNVRACADSKSALPSDAVVQMSRSFSTTWMTDLLQECDTFEGELGSLRCVGGMTTCNDDMAEMEAVPGDWMSDRFLSS